MTLSPEDRQAFVHAPTAGALLTQLTAWILRGGRDLPKIASQLAKEESGEAVRESFIDAMCLYLIRDASGAETAGPEFVPFMGVIRELKSGRVAQPLREWIDRHLGDQPSQDGELRFAKAVWALMHVSSIDSEEFVRWWMERAEKHREAWAGHWITPEAMRGAAARPRPS